MINTLRNICELLLDPKSLYASLRWTKFSLTSYKMLSSLKKQELNPKSIIDVGANVGQFAVASANIYPDSEVYSFEPLPECFSQLQDNSRPYKNITVCQMALGEEKGSVTFNVNKHSHSSSILPLSDNHKKSFPDAEVSHEIEVEVNTLDSALEAIELVSPVLLKIDVQGYESQVLAGSQKIFDKIDYVILESSFKPMYEGELLFLEIINQMKEYGFVFNRPVGWLESIGTGEIVQMDMLFNKK